MTGSAKTIAPLLALATLLTLSACRSGNDKTAVPPVDNITAGTANRPVTTIQWLDSAKNIGRVSEGEKVEISFRFRNTGTNPLVVNNVVVSCGCTVAEKPEQPIAPGAEGSIKAAFNSQGRAGTNHKTLTVYTNTPEPTSLLNFEVEVVKAKS
jgi:hypothetical protein